MKKRIVLLCWAFVMTMMVMAQVTDAFQGILPVTDPAMRMSLNGVWNLKVVEGVGTDDRVPATDVTWGTIPVPGCWETYGFCKPKYDSPNPLTGYYRTTFTVPKAWKGQRIVLCFDGVLYGYDLWVNGKNAGSWRSGYNTALFDITDFLSGNDEQQLAIRVISQFRGSDFDYNDDWAPNGIFRDVTLMAVPTTHLSDLTIRTKNTGEVSIETTVVGKGAEVCHEIFDADGQFVGTDKVVHPHLWTAETPYLYTLRTTLLKKGKVLQTFNHRFGFRELSIDGNVLKLNGQPIKLRGVTCHSTDPRTVKVITDDLTLHDMRLMKEASVNYIRTSHYPREPRFYELADSLGFYVIDEVPFGYGDKNLTDSTFYPVLQQRAQATIRRDKNHPSVLIWSLGNENPLTDICVRLGDYVRTQLDPSRPYCYPQVGSYFRRFWEKATPFPSEAPIYAPHYPTTDQIAGFYQHLDRPVIFTEYCHSLGISFEDHDRQWEIIERTPGIVGGSVWEWVDQGMPFFDDESRTKTEELCTSRYGYEERVYTSSGRGFDMCGNKGTDGLLYADRTPLPNYFELQHNYARAFVSAVCRDTVSTAGVTTLTIRNRYDFLNLKDHVTFYWILTCNRDTVARGAFSPDCAPHDSVDYALSFPVSSSRLSILHFAIQDTQLHTFLRQSFVLNKPQLDSHVDFPSKTNFAETMPFVQQGPLVRVGRKPTMAEQLRLKDCRIERYLQPLSNPYVKAQVDIRHVGLTTCFSYSLTPVPSDTVLTELGVAFLLDKDIDRVQWVGQGPFAAYPGRSQANRYGFWALHKDDLYFEGNRMGVDAALLTDSLGNGLLLVCGGASVNFEQTDRGLVLTVNAAVSGQGPKFRSTAFAVVAKDVGTTDGNFRLYRIEKGQLPPPFDDLFDHANAVQAPCCPFVTRYDTYLMRYIDILGQGRTEY